MSDKGSLALIAAKVGWLFLGCSENSCVIFVKVRCDRNEDFLIFPDN
jgi:hypothetical protein